MAASINNQPRDVPDNLSRVRDHSSPITPPPSIDPAIIVVPEDFTNDTLVSSAREALRTAKAAVERALDTQRAIMANEVETEMSRHLQARDKVHQTVKPALERVQKSIDALHERVGKLDDHLRGPPAPANAVQQIAVVAARTMLASMTPQQRRAAVSEAIASDDLVALQAVTRTAPFTFGASKLEAEGFALEWARAHASQQLEQRRVFAQTLEHVERAGKLTLQFATSLSSAQITARAEALRSRAQAAISAVPAE